MTSAAPAGSSGDVARQLVRPDEDLPQLLSRLLDELPVGLILYDARNAFRVTYANPVMEAWAAPENRPLLGRTLGEVFPGIDVQLITDALTEVARSGVSQNWRNFRFRRPGSDGEPDHATYWDWNAIPLPDEAGETRHVMAVAINETAQEMVRERLQVSLDLALDLTSSLDPDVVVDRLLERALMAVGADRASLIRIEGDEAVTAGSIDAQGGAPPRGTRWPITVPAFRRMLQDHKALVERARPEDFPADVQEGLAGVLHSATIPLVVEGAVFAALAVNRRRDEPFSSSDVLTIQQIGSVSVLALRNALLFADAQAAHQAAERTAQRLRIGVELALDLAEQPTPAAVIRQVLRRVVDTLEVDGATLVSVQGDEVAIEDCVAVGNAEMLRVGSRWPASGQPLVAEALRQRQPVRGRNDNPGLRHDPEDLWDVKHAVMVPLVLQGEVTALLGASRLADPPLSDEEIATLQQVGSVAVLAVRNARLLEQAQEASRAKSDFLNLAAHELRTPLSVISGYLSMIQDGSFGPPSDGWRAPLDTVAMKASELSDLVRSLLTAARLQAGTLPSNRVPVDLRQAVRDACARAQPRSEMLGGQVVLAMPDSPVAVSADEDQVGRVLDNLLNNGLTYSEPPARVEVTLTAGEVAEVLVVDNGIGIEPAQQLRVFERFYRADPAVTMQSGTGLGLYIARELANQHGGTLELVASHPGQGSTFAFRLPIL